MKRRLLHLLTALSLLMFVAVVALWVRSYIVGEWIGKRYLTRTADGIHATDWRMWTGRGSVEISVRRFRWGETADWTPGLRGEWRRVRDEPPHDVAAAGPLPAPLNEIGFGARWDAALDGTYDRAVAAPLWLGFILFAAVPAARLYSRIRGHPNGHCVRCGYDLRATPGRCPECGRVAGRAGG